MPGDIPEGSQEKGKGKGKGISLPEGAQSAVSDPNGEAWQAAVALLTSAGKVRETAARSLFGKLLKDHGLEARDLHPSILSARLNGTLDPQAYLTRAAQAVAARKGTGKQAAPTSAQWDDDSWATAIRLFREGGEWDAACGPTPDENGCRAPAHLLSAANVVPLEAARRA